MYELDFQRQPGARTSVVSRKESCVYFDVQRSVHFGDFVLGSSLLAFEESLAVFIKLEGGDDAVGRVDGELGLLSVGLLSGHLVNIDAPSSAVYRHDLAFSVGVSSTDDLDAVSLSEGDGAASVLLLEVLGKVGGEELSSLG